MSWRAGAPAGALLGCRRSVIQLVKHGIRRSCAEGVSGFPVRGPVLRQGLSDDDEGLMFPATPCNLVILRHRLTIWRRLGARLQGSSVLTGAHDSYFPALRPSRTPPSSTPTPSLNLCPSRRWTQLRHRRSSPGASGTTAPDLHTQLLRMYSAELATSHRGCQAQAPPPR